MKLELAEPARRQAAEIEGWWAENRPAAPSLFAQEFRDALELICRNPGVGTSWPTARRPDLRRVLMPRTKHHVYFRVDVPKKVVQVLAVWGAPRALERRPHVTSPPRPSRRSGGELDLETAAEWISGWPPPKTLPWANSPPRPGSCR